MVLLNRSSEVCLHWQLFWQVSFCSNLVTLYLRSYFRHNGCKAPMSLRATIKEWKGQSDNDRKGCIHTIWARWSWMVVLPCLQLHTNFSRCQSKLELENKWQMFEVKIEVPSHWWNFPYFWEYLWKTRDTVIMGTVSMRVSNSNTVPIPWIPAAQSLWVYPYPFRTLCTTWPPPILSNHCIPWYFHQPLAQYTLFQHLNVFAEKLIVMKQGSVCPSPELFIAN